MSAGSADQLMGQYKGVVKWFNGVKHYGFLGHDDGSDVFVHFQLNSKKMVTKVSNKGKKSLSISSRSQGFSR